MMTRSKKNKKNDEKVLHICVHVNVELQLLCQDTGEEETMTEA